MILIDSLSQPCDLFEFRLFIIDRISSHLFLMTKGLVTKFLCLITAYIVMQKTDNKVWLFLRSFKSFHHLLAGEVLKGFSYCLKSVLIFSTTFQVLFRDCFLLLFAQFINIFFFGC